MISFREMLSRNLVTGMLLWQSCFVFALSMTPLSAAAEEFPARPITLMMILGAGGPTDALTRALAKGMSEQLGKQVIVENRPGANGAIASLATARAAPDGYTLLLTANTTHTLTPFVQKGSKFDPANDFTPITMLSKSYNVLVVNKSVPATTFPELMEFAKSKPQGLAVATFGMGARLAVAQLRMASGASLLEVPYSDGGKGIQALISGDVDMFFDGPGLVRTRVDEGMYRAIAVLGPKRAPNLPDVPALAEFIPGFEMPIWLGIVAPAGVPAEIVEKIHKAVVASSEIPSVRKAAAALGIAEFVGNSSQGFKKIIGEEATVNPELVRRFNLVVN